MYLARHATAKGFYLQISGCDVKLSERYIQIKKNSWANGIFLQHRTKWHRGLLMYSFYNPAIGFLLHLYKHLDIKYNDLLFQ